MSDEDQIEVLSPQIANQIAAGEVIERPASVVKELLENALDARATRIEVSIAQGGRTLIELADDGTGMTRRNAEAAFQRQATSKLREIHDLQALSTLGFRGEALPSIASVARVTLRTCRQGETLGTEIVIQAGKMDEPRDAARPHGATFSVRDLFYNVPARRKFLRSVQTEQAHIKQMVVNHALAHPEVAFVMRADGRELLRVPPAGSLRDRIADLFSLAFAEELLPFSVRTLEASVSGFVAPLHLAARGGESEYYIFVNGRPAAAPVVFQAIRQALPDAERKPALFLFIEVDPSQVDVNVHPAKREVRFRNPMAVRDLVARALTVALTQVSQEVEKPELPPVLPVPVENTPWQDSTSATPEMAVPVLPPPDDRQEDLRCASRRLSYIPPAPVAPQPELRMPSEEELAAVEGGPWWTCKIFGQSAEGYVVLETDSGLVVLDPQAARERILFEQLMLRVQGSVPDSQRLLLPETVTLGPRQGALIRQFAEAFEEMGIGVAELTPDTFMVESMPPELLAFPARTLLADIAQDLETLGAKRGSERWREEVLVRAACKAAGGQVKAMAEPEIRKLIDELARCAMPYTSPRGRPTMILTSFRELTRRFGKG